MPFFFSRRRFVNSRFTNAASDEVRYIAVPAVPGPGAGEQWHILKRKAWVEKVLAKSRNGRVLIYVHGYNTSQRQMVGNLRKIEAGLGAHDRSAIVGFDWPSDGNVLAYNWDSRDIARTGPSLIADGIRPFLDHPRCKGVSVLAHSRGAHLTALAFQEDRTLGAGRQLDNVVFIGADIMTRDFKLGTPARKRLHRVTRRFTNYYNTEDGALWISKLAWSFRNRVGKTGLPNPPGLPHSDVNCDAQYRRDHASHLSGRLAHSFYFVNGAFYRDLALTLAGKPVDQMRTRKPYGTGSDQQLWVQ